ncbi:MAG: hypothetical protein ACLFR1_00910 [Spirochaetia bacterium]
MIAYYFNIGLIYFIIGFAAALYFRYVLKKPLLGNFFGALIVGVIGAYLGGVIDYLFQDIIEYLANFNNSVNLFPPILTALFLLWILTKVSDKK